MMFFFMTFYIYVVFILWSMREMNLKNKLK